ncbi:MAG: hypothetical protein ACI3ZB_11215 [Prevotella sp.]
MKKSIYIYVLLLIVLLVASCNGEKSRQERVAEFRQALTSEDTVAMLKICDDAMAMLQAKDYDRLFANLYEYTDSTQEVKLISEATKKSYLRKFQMFPVLEFERTGYSFQLEGCNDVRYKVTFAPADSVGTSEAPVTHYMFNPVKVDGNWKLCVKTANDEIDMSMR